MNATYTEFSSADYQHFCEGPCGEWKRSVIMRQKSHKNLCDLCDALTEDEPEQGDSYPATLISEGGEP